MGNWNIYFVATLYITAVRALYPGRKQDTMTIHKAKASDYNTVDSICIYDYIRQYVDEIRREVEPVEDKTGNAYKSNQSKFQKCDRTQLKAIAAELETVCKRLDYMLHGKY
jgi:hypothetical protein